jgi:AcrR family transcriptional regulator
LSITVRKTRERDPVATRKAILAAARTILAKDGPEGLSVAQVAMLAGVNRGTAYQHFPDRKSLLNATIASVSEALIDAVWPDGQLAKDGLSFNDESLPQSAGRLAEFTAKNATFSRIWLFELLSSADPGSDPFSRAWMTSVKAFCASDQAVEGVDAEAYAVITLMAYLSWPVWVHTEKLPSGGQKTVAQRIVDEILRGAMFGIMKQDRFPTVHKLLESGGKSPPKKAATARRSR